MVNTICPCGFSVPKGTKCDCRQKAATRRQAANDAARGTPAERGYDKDWYRATGGLPQDAHSLLHAELQRAGNACRPHQEHT